MLIFVSEVPRQRPRIAGRQGAPLEALHEVTADAVVGLGFIS